MEKGGLNITHEGASSAVQNTQSEVNVTLEVSDLTTWVTPLNQVVTELHSSLCCTYAWHGTRRVETMFFNDFLS